MFKKKNFGSINWIGSYALFTKECKRFIKVYQQTIMAPAFTALLFFLVINIAVEGKDGKNYNYMEFLAPGLIIMTMMQNSFANTSSSILSSKVAGNIVDLLMPPFSVNEIIISYTLAAVIRAFLVGFITFLSMIMFVELKIINTINFLYFAIVGSIFLALLGLVAGIWAEKFDNMSGITNFVITPLTFLSGTFYSIEKLPQPFFTISLYNPFYYVIDGFRNAFIDLDNSYLVYGITYLTVLSIVLYILCYIILKKGWRLKP